MTPGLGRRVVWFLIISGITFTLTVTMVAAVTVFKIVDESVHEIRDVLISSCERGNTLRERQNIIIEYLGLELEPLPIVDCVEAVG